MILRVERETVDRWRAALIRAKTQEIGGVLYGEHVGAEDFRIIGMTIQGRGGNEASFQRKAGRARRELRELSRLYGDDPKRFNYLGEWHSHPGAPVFPSRVDEATMRELLAGSEVDLNFLVLLINQLAGNGALKICAVVYLVSGQRMPCQVILETGGEAS